jgi:hypothetical protein
MMGVGILVDCCHSQRNFMEIFRGLRIIFVSFCVGLVAILSSGENRVSADPAYTVKWDAPQQLSDASIQAFAPGEAADSEGHIHVMWSERMLPNQLSGEGDTLFYTRWDGKRWSAPIDVLVSPVGGWAEFPSLGVTPDGNLHAVWSTGGINGVLMYARAPACCADDPRNWTYPVALGGPVNLTNAFVVDSSGGLNVAYADISSGKIIYRRSDDSGRSWSTPVAIPAVQIANEEQPAYPRLAVDHRGRVHLVWSVMPYPGRYIMYARSEDNGASFSEPQIIDQYDPGQYHNGYGPIYLDVEAIGNDEIHLNWDGAPTIERHHIWSKDGGKTWSEPNLLFPEIVGAGRSGWNDMAADSGNVLHMVALKMPWYSYWNGVGWTHSENIGNQNGYAEYVSIVVSQGNQLNVVWVTRAPGINDAVWYVHGVTSSPATAPIAYPTQEVQTPATQITGEQTPVAQKSPTPDLALSDRPTTPGNPGSPIVAGAGLAFLVIVGGFVFIWVRVHRGS